MEPRIDTLRSLMDEILVVIGKCDSDGLRELAAKDFAGSLVGSAQMFPLEEFMRQARDWRTAFADFGGIRTVDFMAADMAANAVAVQVSQQLRHGGVLHTPFGDRSPTGKLVTLTMVYLATFNNDGQLVRFSTTVEWGELLNQLHV